MTGFAGDSSAKKIISDEENMKKLLERYPKSFFSVYTGIQEPDCIIECAVDSEDASEGGVLAALWRILKRNRKGADFSMRKIPIRQQCIEICEFFGLDPYKENSEGCRVWLLKGEDPRAVTIGETSKGPAVRRIDGSTVSYLRRPGS